MIGKYSVHTTKDLKNENCDGRGYRLVRITKKKRLGAILSRALEPDLLTYFKGAESNKMGSQAKF